MADQGRLQRARRIIGLDVEEVSLVDRPANKREFLVLKRINPGTEEEMGAFESQEAVEKARKQDEDEDMEQADKKKAEGKEKQDEMPEDEMEQADKKKAKDKECAEDEVTKAVNPAALAGMLRGLKGAPSGPLKELMSWLEAQKAEGGKDEYPEPGMKAKAQKSVDPMEGASVIIKEDGTVMVSESVTKARHFTASRTSALKDAASGILGLLKEVDPDGAMEVASKVKELPSRASVPQAIKPVGVSKSEGGDTEEVTALKATVARLEKRLADIEETRAPSKSESDQAAAESTKVEKSLWSGVL